MSTGSQPFSVDPRIALELQQLVARYIHIVDDSVWRSLGQVFTDDAVCDYTAFGIPLLRGLDEIVRAFSSMQHPIAHHAVNTLIEPGADASSLRLRSKMLLVMAADRLWSGEYRDLAVQTERGWRFAQRIAIRPARLRTTITA
jgi:hypothetical protein